MKANKKKIITIIIISVIAACTIGYVVLRILPIFTPVNIKTFDGVTYKVYSDHAEVYSADEDCDTKIVIKDTVLGKKVTVIGKEAFMGIPVREVILSDNVEIIDRYAFYHAYSLRNVTFGNHVKEIRYGAFAECEKLEGMNLPDSLEVIGQDSLDGDFDEIVIPENVKVIECFGLSFFPSYVEFEGTDVNIHSFNIDDSNLMDSNEEFVVVCHSLLQYNGDAGVIRIPEDVYYVNARFPENSTIYLHDQVKAMEIDEVLYNDNVTVYIPKTVTHICAFGFWENSSQKAYVVEGSEAEEFLKNSNISYEVISEIVYPKE